VDALPCADLDFERMPGHWLLARLGKRVLRPGGIRSTHQMLEALAIGSADEVVELAPGLGTTARLVLARQPAAYVGVERDESAAATVRRKLQRPEHRCLVGTAADTGLEEASADVVFGEAMLTMQSDSQKARIVREALRLLRPGGRYGIHELAVALDEVPEELNRDLARAIRVGARPLTPSGWRALLEAEGFRVECTRTAPMQLLAPGRAGTRPRRRRGDNGPDVRSAASGGCATGSGGRVAGGLRAPLGVGWLALLLAGLACRRVRAARVLLTGVSWRASPARTRSPRRSSRRTALVRRPPHH